MTEKAPARAPGNLGHTQQLFAIWNERDFEALLAHLTEDVEWKPATMSAVEGGSFKGPEGFREFFEEWDKTWATWHVDPESIDEIGDQVLVLGHVHAEGRGSGLELDQPVAYLFEFRDGLLARGQTFFDHDEARRAAGSEEARP